MGRLLIPALRGVRFPPNSTRRRKQVETFMWGAAAASIAIVMEVIYRKSDVYPWWTLPIAVGLQYSLYRTVHGGPSLIHAVAAFSVMTVLIRAFAAQFILHEPIARGTALAVVLLILAALTRLWR